jgi:hypothetical protein
MRSTRVGSVNERFFNRFERDYSTKCWNWTGLLSPKGYGKISGVTLDGTKVSGMLAHRVSWLLHNGPIPEGEGAHGTVVMHICDNPRCVNPAHLRLGTQGDNVQDMVQKGRRKAPVLPTGLDHWRSSFTDQADIDLICSTNGQTKELAAKFGVAESTIKRVRRRNGVVKPDAEKYVNKPLSQEAIDHIRSTKPGTRGLGKLYGVGKTTISNIRKGLTHAR